jgi:hypothetical protein
MTNIVDRLTRAARRILNRKIYAITRKEWESLVRSDGSPTKLTQPLTPFVGITVGAIVETCAMSTTPFTSPGGFHIVRRDEVDAPDIFNTDSYNEIDLASRPHWEQIIATAGLTDSQIKSILRSHVFLIPKRRRDHHSPQTIFMKRLRRMHAPPVAGSDASFPVWRARRSASRRLLRRGGSGRALPPSMCPKAAA